MTPPHLHPRAGLAPQPENGDFVRLPQGVTHYQVAGPDDAPLVVLVHGFSVPYFIWDPTFEFLTQSGFRVLRYDLLGRGFSERPAVRYGIDLFVTQLHSLLDALGWQQPVSVLGLSMGGPISAAFTARHPQRVARLGLIDPAGAAVVAFPWFLRLLSAAPGLGERLFTLVGEERLVQSIASDFFDPALVAAFIERYRPQMQYRGFVRAILSTMREGMVGDFSAVYRQVGALGLPVLLLWGAHDATVPIAHSQILQAAIPQAQFHLIPRSGHIPHYERPEAVNPLLADFLSRGK
ncbi:MAG: alpha/beta fold hydrolase [Anaerolineales bacterium]